MALALDTQGLDESSSVESLVSLHVLLNYAFRTQVTLNIFTLGTVNSSDVLLKIFLRYFFSAEVTHYFLIGFILCFAIVFSMRVYSLNPKRLSAFSNELPHDATLGTSR